MHLYIAARGILDKLNRWENDILATYYPFFQEHEQGDQKINGKNHRYLGMLQTSVRPIRFYEIIVPEMHKDAILRKLQPTQVWNKKYEKFIWMIRKALRLEKVPPFPPRISSDAMCWDGVNCTAIGIKKDKWIDGKEQI